MKCDQLHRLLGSHNMSHPSNSLSLTLLLPGCQLLSPLHPLCNNLYLSLLAPGCHFLSPLPCLFHNNLLKRVLNHALFFLILVCYAASLTKYILLHALGHTTLLWKCAFLLSPSCQFSWPSPLLYSNHFRFLLPPGWHLAAPSREKHEGQAAMFPKFLSAAHQPSLLHHLQFLHMHLSHWQETFGFPWLQKSI